MSDLLKLRVLIVDDSLVYRSKIRAALENIDWITIVGVASNGKIALEMLEQKPVDLVTLDMEMPTLDGLSTLRALRKKGDKTKVIMFSSSTLSGSEATMEALSCGADDFVAKPNGQTGEAPEIAIARELIPKLRQFVAVPAPSAAPTHSVESPRSGLLPSKDIDTFIPDAIVIASSTGGPAAHEILFNQFGKKLRCPILIAQHMPPVFTAAFAKRLSEYSGLPAQEAQDGAPVKNEIYIAPGDFHLTLKKQGDQVIQALTRLPQRNSVRPAADYLFESAAETYGSKCMGVVLTGMGEDGLVGSQAIKTKNGGILIQSKEDCVVFGMPGAVFSARAYDSMGKLEFIRAKLQRMALA